MIQRLNGQTLEVIQKIRGVDNFFHYDSGEKPWSFKTSKGIFSTPVIDEVGNIYVGSADKNFYVRILQGSTPRRGDH